MNISPIHHSLSFYRRTKSLIGFRLSNNVFLILFLTSIYELLDAASVVDEVCALLHRVLHQLPAVQDGGAGVAYASSAGSPAVTTAHVAPETWDRGGLLEQETPGQYPGQSHYAGEPETRIF